MIDFNNENEIVEGLSKANASLDLLVKKKLISKIFSEENYEALNSFLWAPSYPKIGKVSQVFPNIVELLKDIPDLDINDYYYSHYFGPGLFDLNTHLTISKKISDGIYKKAFKVKIHQNTSIEFIEPFLQYYFDLEHNKELNDFYVQKWNMYQTYWIPF